MKIEGVIDNARNHEVGKILEDLTLCILNFDISKTCDFNKGVYSVYSHHIQGTVIFL